MKNIIWMPEAFFYMSYSWKYPVLINILYNINPKYSKLEKATGSLICDWDSHALTGQQ